MYREKSRYQWIQYARKQTSDSGCSVAHDPERTIHVNPLEITRVCRMHIETKGERGSKLYDFGRVPPGDWDMAGGARRNIPVEETIVHRSVFTRYTTGTPWEELPVFEHKLKAIDERGRIDNCTSRAELADRYHRLDKVFEELRDTGWRLEEQVGGLFEDNVSVSVSRTGGLLLGTGGAHRLAIAKFLRLPAIEVYVLSRHPEWVDVRARAAAGDTFPHPDLAEFGR